MKKWFSYLLFFLFSFRTAFADPETPETPTFEYSPLVSADMFDPIRADVTTVCLGIISVLIIIVAVVLIQRAFTH